MPISTAARTSARRSDPAVTIGGVYDALSQGKDNYHGERAIAARLAAALPGGADSCRALVMEQRDFLRRALAILVSRRWVDQIVMCGADFTMGESVVNFVRRHTAPGSDRPRVVVLDDNPVAVLHVRHELTQDAPAVAVEVDLTDPDAVLEHPDLVYQLDLSRPVGLVHCGWLPHLQRDGNPMAQQVMARWTDLLPEGSFIAVSHLAMPSNDDVLAAAAKKATDVFTSSELLAGAFLPRPEIQSLFHDWSLIPPALGVDPAVVPCGDFWSHGPTVTPSIVRPLVMGGLARKGAPLPVH